MALEILPHLQIDKLYVTQAIAPHLKSNDENIKKLARYMLIYVDERSRLREPDFSAYKSFLSSRERNKKEPLMGLIDLMYEIDPNKALQITGSIYGKSNRKMERATSYLVSKSLLENEFNQSSQSEIYSQTRKALDTMAKEGQWWEKLYVKAVLKKYKFLN